MKKIKCLIVLIMFLLLTGCSSYNMNMKISKNKSMEYSVTILSDYYNNDIANNILIYKERYEQYGFNIIEYNQNGQYGMIITKSYASIDDISDGKRSDEFDLLYLYSVGYDENVENKMFNVEKGFDTNRYAANFYVDLSNLGISPNATVTYSVELPEGSISNNANVVSEDGKVLTWNISSSGKTDIDFVFELKSYDFIYYSVAVIVIVFLVFLIFGNLFVPLSKNEKKNQENEKKNNSSVNDKKINNSNNVKSISVNDNLNDVNDISNLQTLAKNEKRTFNRKNISSEINGINNNEEVDAMINNMQNINANTNSQENFDNYSSGGVADWYESDVFIENNIATNNEVISVKPITQDEANTNINMDTGFNNPLDINYDVSAVTSVDNKVNNDNESNDENSGPVIRINSKSVVVNNKKEDV